MPRKVAPKKKDDSASDAPARSTKRSAGDNWSGAGLMAALQKKEWIELVPRVNMPEIEEKLDQILDRLDSIDDLSREEYVEFLVEALTELPGVAEIYATDEEMASVVKKLKG